MKFSLSLLLLALTASCPPAFAQKKLGYTTFEAELPPSANATAWDQVVDFPEMDPALYNRNLFIGRRGITNGNQELAMAQINWGTKKLDWVTPPGSFMDFSQPIHGGYNLVSAYDPYLLTAHGELWVAFECSNASTDPNPLGAAFCMGPINIKNSAGQIDYTGASWKLIMSRTTAVMQQTNHPQNGIHSASVPKVFFWKSIPYVYYSVVKMDVTGNTWYSVTTRGARLENTNTSGGGRFQVYQSQGNTIGADHPDFTKPIVETNPNDAFLNKVADSYAVYTDGPAGNETNLYLIGAVGGTTNVGDPNRPCTKVDWLELGCYKAFIAKANNPGNDPLQPYLFDQFRVKDTSLYINSSQYLRQIKDNNGQKWLWANYLPRPDVNLTLYPQFASRDGSGHNMSALQLDVSTMTYEPTTMMWTKDSGFHMSAIPGGGYTNRIDLANSYLWYQPNGDLVLYNHFNHPLWHSGTVLPNDCTNQGHCRAIFQSQGNFVLYDFRLNPAYYYHINTIGTGEYLYIGNRPAYYHFGIQNSSHQWVWGQWGTFPWPAI